MTVLRATIALSLALLTVSPALAGGPPLITDDAGTVEVGKFEVELSGAYTRDKKTAAGVATRSDHHETEMKVSTGLSKNIGISLAIPYAISDRDNVNGSVSTAEGFGDMSLELKYAFAELGGVAFAVKPALTLPTGRYSDGLSEGRWQFGTTLIATREFAEGNYAVHANLGYEHHDYRNAALRDTSRGSLWSGSVAGEIRLYKGLTAVLDCGLATNPDKRSKTLPVYALAGVRYEISELLDINAGVKTGLTDPEDDLSLRYGLTLKF